MDYNSYRAYLSTFTREDLNEYLKAIPPTIRINTIKVDEQSFLSFTSLSLKKSPLPLAYFVEDDNIKLGNTVEFFLGYIHTQSLSSMLPPLVLSPHPHEKVYDIAAAPGSKTTQMAAMMKNTGVIYANDITVSRISALIFNINRLGVLNTVVLQRDGRKILKTNYFDKALADVPCTGLGSSPTAYLHFSLKATSLLSKKQRLLLLSAFDSLKEGGELVYSTCTFTAEENEEVISFLLQRRPNARLENISLPYDIPHDTGLSDYGREFRKTWRIYPWHLNSEGFFLAKVVKEWV